MLAVHRMKESCPVDVRMTKNRSIEEARREFRLMWIFVCFFGPNLPRRFLSMSWSCEC